MKTGFKQVNGLLWPETDTECLNVVFRDVKDLDRAIQHCKQRRLVIQAGGNCGVWPRYLADFFERVHTFEPEPDNHYCLLMNVMDRPMIRVYKAALGRTHSYGRIYYQQGKNNIGACRVIEVGETENTIPIVTLDEYRSTQVDLLQLDTEGTEPLIILGAHELIMRCRPVIMVEDKGLSKHYGFARGWSIGIMNFYNYRLVDQVNNDWIYAPQEVPHG